MQGRFTLITGASNGIGLETARALARRGATVVMACRDLERSAAIRDDLRRDTGNERITLLPLDLSSLKSIRRFAATYAETHGELHVLKHSSKRQTLAVNQLSNSIYSAPVVADGTLYISTSRRLYAIEKPRRRSND